MAAPEFGDYLDEARRRRGWSLARVAIEIGVLSDERVFNETQVKRLLEGRRLLDAEIVQRSIEALDLDPPTAWEKAGLWPPGLTAEVLRKVTRPAVPALAAASATSRRRRSDRSVRAQGKRTQDQLRYWRGQRPALTIIAGEREKVPA
jgi:transcriptional regulator with XRE-family HTH domain